MPVTQIEGSSATSGDSDPQQDSLHVLTLSASFPSHMVSSVGRDHSHACVPVPGQLLYKQRKMHITRFSLLESKSCLPDCNAGVLLQTLH